MSTANADALNKLVQIGYLTSSSGHMDAAAQIRAGDFDFDGRDDVVCHKSSTGEKWISLANTSGQFLGTSRFWYPVLCNHASGQFMVGNFDGGPADFLCHDTSSGWKWIMNMPR